MVSGFSIGFSLRGKAKGADTTELRQMISRLLTRLGATLSLSCLLFTHSARAQTAPEPLDPDTVNRELIVKFKSTATDAEIAHALQTGRLTVKRHKQTLPMKERGHHGLTAVESEFDHPTAIARLKNHPAIDYIEPNVHYQHRSASNDPYVTANYTWGLYGDLSSPANAFGSQAAEAWGAGYTGTNTVYVAVIDQGMDISHPDLAPNVWINPFDPPDGIDNDGNGYIDDVNGWNFAANSNQVFDSTGDTHGTHVAGTIGAKGGNAVGVAGVNWNVTILSGKFLTSSGGDTLNAVEAIDYFVDMKKRHNLNLVAINASWGGGGYSQSLHDAIIRAAKAGIIFVAAAGNSSANNDTVADWPANIDTRVGTSTESAAAFDGVISVAAIDSTGALASFSNYGATKVHLGAPGVSILSTYPGSQYAYMDGTSMATPHVTGAVALYASTHPGASAQSIRDALLGSVIATPSLTGKTSTGGRLNLSSVIAPTPVVTTPPPAVPASPSGAAASTTAATVAGNSTVTFRWNAVTDASSYKVKRATSSAGPWTVIASGVTVTSYSQAVTANGTTYYYRADATNAAGDSADSATATVTPVPPAPASLTATALSSTQVQLRWLDRSSDEQGFKLEYWNGSTWVQFGTVAAGTTSVNVTGTVSRATYNFRIRAYNSMLNTPYSNTASVTMP